MKKLINCIFEIQQTSIKILLNLERDIKYQIFLTLITELYQTISFRATSVTGSAVNELHQRGSHNMYSVVQLKAMKCCFLCCMLLSFICYETLIMYHIISILCILHMHTFFGTVSEALIQNQSTALKMTLNSQSSFIRLWQIWKQTLQVRDRTSQCHSAAMRPYKSSDVVFCFLLYHILQCILLASYLSNGVNITHFQTLFTNFDATLSRYFPT